MKNTIEISYGNIVKGVFRAVNPVKKRLIKTYCLVHKYINCQALFILQKENYNEEFEFYSKHLDCLNQGAVWADQDFKSINHFFHYEKEKGIYGFSNALNECKKYYNKAKIYCAQGNVRKGMFYLGAACHLVQDSNVPQHINNRFLEKHRGFEVWIIDRVINKNSFPATAGVTQYATLYDFIKNNARKSHNIDKRYSNIEDKEKRYGNIASEILLEAESTTAGLLVKFYNEEISNKEHIVK